jgi:ethylbenzene dioxygenase beta subunit
MSAATGVETESDAAMDWTTWHEVQQFLFREARLLDGCRYRDWLGLLTEDVHYWMPVIENTLGRGAPHRYDPGRLAFFDDDLEGLRRRVEKLANRTAWTENPPTRQCHAISNVEVEATVRHDELLVHSVFVHHRGMGERDEFTLVGRREDLVRRTPDGLRLARRLIVIDQHVLLARNLNVFF